MKAISFSFENNAIRAIGDIDSTVFVASDVCNVLGYKRARDAVAQHVYPEDVFKREVETSGGKQTVNCVNESGLYALIFGSKLESAKAFKRWVTSEVLPQIRRTGRYECPLANAESTDGKLNEVERYEIQKAISKRAKDCSVHYQTIYHALYDRFRVASYKDLRRDQLSAALTFIEVVPLTPQIEAPKPEIPEGFYLVDRNTLLAMHSIVYLMWLNKPEFDQIGCAMRCLGSNITGRFRGFTLETQGPRKVVERALEKFGFDCRLPSREVLSIPL